MPEVLTNPGEVETVTTPPPPKRAARPPRTPKHPSVEVLKEIVMRHCGYMTVANVDGLCHQQTEALIDELAQHFG